LDEITLIRSAQSGNREALTRLLRDVEGPIYQTAFYLLHNEADARDVTQDTLLRICQKLSDYEVKATFKTWALRIASNRCIDLMRKKKPAFSIDQEDWDMPSNQSTESAALHRVMQEEVRVAMAQLPEAVRIVVTLRYMNDLSYQAISQETNLPINTVKSHLYRAKLWLQRKFTQQDVQEEVR
jgi:RNA polymerase sigma factor (sigma-70 family)